VLHVPYSLDREQGIIMIHQKSGSQLLNMTPCPEATADGHLEAVDPAEPLEDFQAFRGFLQRAKPEYVPGCLVRAIFARPRTENWRPSITNQAHGF